MVIRPSVYDENTAGQIIPDLDDLDAMQGWASAEIDPTPVHVDVLMPAAAPLAPLQLDAAQQRAIDLAIGPDGIRQTYTDISGTAGVGKTFVAKQILERAVPGSVVLAATTGIAAVNLGEGTTINALLRYFDTADLRAKYVNGALQATVRRLRKSGVQRILLDEKSMLSGQQLNYIARAIREVNEGQIAALESMSDDFDYTRAEEDALPPIGLTLIGDFGQLPPVPDKEEITKLDGSKILRSIPVEFAFDSTEWSLFSPHRTVLEKIYRQDAEDFIAALHAVRKGDIRAALDFFTADRFSAGMDDRFQGTTLLPKNDMVDRFNFDALSRLSSAALTYTTVRLGKPRGDWKQIPDVLRLKEGALVMVLANRREPGDEDALGAMIYANGDLGTVLSADANGWQVKLQRNGRVVTVVPIVRENTIPLEPGRRAELKAQGIADEVIRNKKTEVIGSVQYMPLRAGYASTIHKSQGLTLDHVQVNIYDAFMRQPHMLFVALSRARTAEGLRIVGTQKGFVDRCTVEKRVQPWL